MSKSQLANAPLIDFTGQIDGAHQLSGFEAEQIALLRSLRASSTFIVIDRAAESDKMPAQKAPMLVVDHLNLTGTSPLVGPNEDFGDRFPVVQGVYLHEGLLPELTRAVVAGLKPGTKLQSGDAELLTALGAHACCYNLVPLMIVAAHAKCKILAVVVPDGAKLSEKTIAELRTLTGATK